MKAAIQLRLAKSDDASGVADVLISSRAEYLPFAPSAHPPADVRLWVAKQLLTSCLVRVADHCGEIVGVLATSHDGHFSWIAQLYVRPGWVGQGIGSAFLASAHEALRRPIRLYTFQANVRGRRFYERHGYEAIEFTDGQANEERCPDVLYELR